MTLWQSILAWLFGPAPQPTPVPQPIPTPTPQPTPDPPPVPANPLVAAINAARAAKGLKVLKEDPRLTKAAMDWAGTMATMNQMAHSNLGSLMEQLNCPVAECVAEGQPDEASVVKAWLDSPSHRVLILGDFTHVGTGHVGAFWCIDLAKES